MLNKSQRDRLRFYCNCVDKKLHLQIVQAGGQDALSEKTGYSKQYISRMLYKRAKTTKKFTNKMYND